MYNNSRSQRDYYQPQGTGATYTYSSSGFGSWESHEQLIKKHLEEERRLHEDPKFAENALVDLQERLDDYGEEKRFNYSDFAVYSKRGHVHSDVERGSFLDMCDQHLNSYQAQLDQIPTHNNHRLVGLNRTMNTDIKTYREKVATERESWRRETDREYDWEQRHKEYRQERSERLSKLQRDPKFAEAALVELKQRLNEYGAECRFNYPNFATHTEDGRVRSDAERDRFLDNCDQNLKSYQAQSDQIPTHNSFRLEGLQNNINLGIANYREKVADNRGSVMGEIW